MAEQVRTYQARLAMIEDNIRRRITDLQISHEGHPTDCIRVRYTTNDEGDILTRIYKKADLISVIFPPMNDVPYRRLNQAEDGSYEITSPIAAGEDDAKKNYEIITTHGAVLLPNDLIIRVYLDPEVNQPIVVCLQVLESLGTFGGQMLIKHKYNTNLYNETLDDYILKIINKMVERRMYINY